MLKTIPLLLGFVGNYAVTHGVVLLPAIGVSWTLAIEEQFYVLYPLILRRLLRFRGAFLRVALVVALAVFVGAGVYRAVLVAPHLGQGELPTHLWTFIYYGTLTQVDAIAAGVLASLVWWRWRSVLVARVTKEVRLLVHPFVLIACVLASMYVLSTFPVFRYWLGYTVLNILWFAVILALLVGFARRRQQPTGFLVQRFAWFGKQGYSLYLVHIVASVLSFAVFPLDGVTGLRLQLLESCGRYALGLILSLVFGYVLWRSVEIPMGRVRRTFVPR
jgi:peptidoglycan/LPS O-acetylase OafA/YrhL